MTGLVTSGNLGSDFDFGSRVAGQINVVRQLDSYRFIKAINANSTTSGAGGFDAALAFVFGTSSPGSNAVRATNAVFAPPGGDFETLVVTPWLTGSTSASPAGLGLTASAAASLIVTLRSSAAAQAF